MKTDLCAEINAFLYWQMGLRVKESSERWVRLRKSQRFLKKLSKLSKLKRFSKRKED